jgi:nucleotide-binding universal stress UspA family protein
MFRRIVVPLDGSALAEAILPQVCRLAVDSPVEVVLLTVGTVPRAVEPRPQGVAHIDELLNEAEQDLRSYLQEKAHQLVTNRVQVKTRVRFGDPATEIARCAEEEEADAIAMSTHGRTGLDRVLHGSVAGSILRSTGLPVILLRPAEGAFPRQSAPAARDTTLI